MNEQEIETKIELTRWLFNNTRSISYQDLLDAQEHHDFNFVTEALYKYLLDKELL
jgi:hypothetical protein